MKVHPTVTPSLKLFDLDAFVQRSKIHNLKYVIMDTF